MEDEEYGLDFSYDPNSGGGATDYSYDNEGEEFGSDFSYTPEGGQPGQRYDAEGERYVFSEGLEWFEDTVIGDFISDMYQDVERGWAQARGIENLSQIITGNYDHQDVVELVKDQKAIEALGSSAEMRDFQKTVADNGGGLWGVILGIAKNPSIIPGVILSSFVSMANAPSIAAGASVWGTTTAAGTAIGGPIGTFLSQLAAAPAALGVASGITDGSISFVEFMREELDKRGEEFNVANVTRLLGDKEVMSTIRSRSAARGTSVGVIDALTAGLSAKAARVIGKATKSAKLSKLGGVGVEGIGGSTGEALAQVTSGQDFNIADIALEGFAELGGPGALRAAAVGSAEVAGLKETEAYVDPEAPLGPEPPIATYGNLTEEGELNAFEVEGEGSLDSSVDTKVDEAVTDLSNEKTITSDSSTVKDTVPAIKAAAKKAIGKALAYERGDVIVGDHLDGIQGAVDEAIASNEDPIAAGIISEVSEDLGPAITAAISELGEQVDIDTLDGASPQVVEAVLAQLEGEGKIIPGIDREDLTPLITQIADQALGQIKESGIGVSSTQSTSPDAVAQQILEEALAEVSETGSLETAADIASALPVMQQIIAAAMNKLSPTKLEVPNKAKAVNAQLNAEAIEVEGEGHSIGINSEPMSKGEVIAFVEDAIANQRWHELAVTPIIVNNDPELHAYVHDRKYLAQLELGYPQDTPSRARIIELERLKLEYIDSKLDGPKLRLAELKKRIKNLMAGLPEEEGIVKEGTETTPAKKSILTKTEYDAPPAPVKPEKQAASTEDPRIQELKDLRRQLAEFGNEGKVGTPEYHKALQRNLDIENEFHREGIKSPDAQVLYSVGKHIAADPNYNGQFLDYHLSKFQGDQSKRRAALKQFLTDLTGMPIGEYAIIGGGGSFNNLKAARRVAYELDLSITPIPHNGGRYMVTNKKTSISRIMPPNVSAWKINYPAVFLTDRSNKVSQSQASLDVKKLVRLIQENTPKAGEMGIITGLEDLNSDTVKEFMDAINKVFPGANWVNKKGKVSISFTRKAAPQQQVGEAGKVDAKTLAKMLKGLAKAFPGVKYIAERDAFQAAVAGLITEGIPVDENAKGFVYEGVVYLDPDRITADTPFHEFAHLFVRAMRINNRPMFDTGIKLLAGSPWEKAVREHPAYQDLSEVEIWEEVMAQVLGEKASEQFDTFQQKTAWQRFVDFVSQWVKDKLKINSDKDFADLTLDDWLDITTKEFGKGTDVSEATQYAAQVNNDSQVNALAQGLKHGLSYYKQSARKNVANREFKAKGIDIPKGWNKLPKYMKMIEDELPTVLMKARRKQGLVEAPAPEKATISNPVFKKAYDMFAESKEKYKYTIAQGLKKHYKDISPDQIAKQLGKVFQNFDDFDVSIADFYKQIGSRILRKKPEGLSRKEFNEAKFHAGAVVLKTLIDNGILDLVKAKVKGKKNKWTHNIVLTDTKFIEELAASVAEAPVDEFDFKSVYLDGPPPKRNGFTEEDGWELISRYHKATAHMNRETHPKVFEILDKADNQQYEMNAEYVELLEEFNKLDLLLDKDEKKNAKPESLRSKRRAIKSYIANMKKLIGKPFYEAHQFVHNGRLMTVSTDISHQGAKYVLAGFGFTKKGPQGKKGWEWTQILAADTFGFTGGETLAERLEFTQQNKDTWIEWANDPLSYKEEIGEADVPMLFLRYIIELKNAEASGNPETYESGLPNHMDATTSGIQFLAALTKDPYAAEVANLTDTQVRFDSYSEIVEQVITDLPAFSLDVKDLNSYNSAKKDLALFKADILEESSKKGKEKKSIDEIQALWDEYNDKKEQLKESKSKEFKAEASQQFWTGDPAKMEKFRKIFKKPVMTKYYSATVGGMTDKIFMDLKDKDLFRGIDFDDARWLAQRIFDGADERLPGPGKMMLEFQEISNLLTENDKYVKYENNVSEFIIVNDPLKTRNVSVGMHYEGKNQDILENKKHSNLETSVAYQTDEKDRRGQRNQIAPLIVHSFDAALVHWLHLNFPGPLQTIHDSFATTPEYTQMLYEYIRIGFDEIVRGDALLNTIEQILYNAELPPAAFEKYDVKNVEQLAKYFHNNMIYHQEAGGKAPYNSKESIKNQFGWSAGVSDPGRAKQAVENAKLKRAELAEQQLTAETNNVQAFKVKEQSKPC